MAGNGIQVDAFGDITAPTPKAAPSGTGPSGSPVASAPALPAQPERSERPAATAKSAGADRAQQSLVVLDHGLVKYADPEVFVADLDALLADDVDPEALFATLNALRNVQASDARKRLVGRVTDAMTARMGL